MLSVKFWQFLFSISSGDGLVVDGTKPLPKPILNTIAHFLFLIGQNINSFIVV